MKTLLVGEVRPEGYRGDLDPRDKGSVGERLCSILGLTIDEYLDRFDRVNLCRNAWDDEAAWLEAQRIQAEDRERIVLLGRKVHSAFDMDHLPLLYRYGRFVILPHPSGRCRVWNNNAAILTARELLHDEV